jgi:hypothetical protein
MISRLRRAVARELPNTLLCSQLIQLWLSLPGKMTPVSVEVDCVLSICFSQTCLFLLSVQFLFVAGLVPLFLSAYFLLDTICEDLAPADYLVQHAGNVTCSVCRSFAL